MSKKWLFKVNDDLYTKELYCESLQELNSFILTHKGMSGFIELENTLVNINNISQICDAYEYTRGAVKI